jgi:hypothetical protein
MQPVTLEHNLTDFELEETLEKALGTLRMKIQRPQRKFHQPAMETVSKRVRAHCDDQTKRMLKRIEAVILG